MDWQAALGILTNRTEILALVAGALLLVAVAWWLTRSRDGHRVVRVVDGDTIVVLLNGEQEKVRLLGVDTPESVKPNHPVERFGKAASAYLGRLLSGRRVELKGDKAKLTRDKYGRILAYAYRVPDGLFINRHLLEKGYARVYRKESFKLKAEFIAIEKQAQRAQRGIWSPSWTFARAFLALSVAVVVIGGAVLYVRPELLALFVTGLRL